MKNFIYSILVLINLGLMIGNSNAQVLSNGSGEWSDGTTWVGGFAPTAIDDVIIASGHTISVSDSLATCNSVSFGGNDALIDMNADARLTIYGNFTLFSTSHTVFSAGWSGSDAKIVFAGEADQILSGWKTSGGSTSFRDVVIDKTGGSVTTDGSGMRLGIQNSLQIINGSFFLNDDDDIEGRWASSGNYTNNPLPNIIVEANGNFDMSDNGYHHIRSGTGVSIGKLTTFGASRFVNASSNGIYISDIDIEDQGDLQLSSELWSSGNGVKFHPGTITAKSGGWINLSTTSPIWDNDSLVDVQAGGVFSTTASSTVFPNNFIENGTVRYGRTSDEVQDITDRNYNHLLVVVNNLDHKSWNLTSNREVEILEINDEGQLLIISATANELQVNNALNVISGSIDLSSSDASIFLNTNATISESNDNSVTGYVYAERTTVQTVNESFGNLGFEINAQGASAGIVNVGRTTGQALSLVNINQNGIFRFFDVNPTNNSALNADIVFHYLDSEINGLNEETLRVFFSEDEGNSWIQKDGIIDVTTNTVSVSGMDAIDGLFTLSTGIIANFTGTPTSGTAPLTVEFIDNSAGNIVSWYWEFGNGGSTPSQNIDYTYHLPGIYTVSLTVTGPGGVSTETKMEYIEVFASNPVADFSASPLVGSTPLEVTFSDLSQGDITNWNWDFGDGATSTEQEPVHTFDGIGFYTVSLTVSGSEGSDTETKTEYIEVKQAAPVADFIADQTLGSAPLTVSFTNLSTGEIDSVQWNFGDGETSIIEDPSHVYTDAGSFTVTLSVFGPGGVDSLTIIDYINISVGIDESNLNTANIYPNPTNNFLNIDFPDAQNRVVIIQNMNGEQCVKRTLSGKNAIISMELLPKGVYSLLITEKGKITKVLKVIK